MLTNEVELIFLIIDFFHVDFSQKSVDTRNWDVFRNLPIESESESLEDQTCYLFVIKLLKVSSV